MSPRFLIAVCLFQGRRIFSSRPRYPTSITFPISEISLARFSVQTSSLDTVKSATSTHYMSAAPMNMARQLKQKPSKKVSPLKKSATNTTKFTPTYTDGSTLVSTTLAVRRLQSKQKSLKPFSWDYTTTTTLSRNLSCNYSALNTNDFWQIGL